MKSRFRPLVEIFGWGCALLAAIQLPGAILDYVIRQRIGPPLVAVFVLVAVAFAILRGKTVRSWPRGWHAIGAAAVAFALAAVMAQASVLLLRHEVTEVSDIGILVPVPGSQYTECVGKPSRCHEISLNALGFRGPLPQRTPPDGKLVAFIGDSYVFGQGVGVDDTLPAVVARRLADLRPPVAVVNAGIPGINGGSFPGVIRYVRTRLDPDMLVVLLKDDDLDSVDKFTRWKEFRSSFWFRMLSATNFEPMYETGRQALRWSFFHGNTSQSLHEVLDAIAAASSGAQLVVVGALNEDLKPSFRKWMTAHPQVAYTTAWENRGFWEAEKIPHDGHWSEAGCARIADFVTPVVRRQLTHPAPR